MDKEIYKEHLALYNSRYREDNTSMFDGWFGLSEIMNVWSSIGNTIKGYETEEGRRCDFLDKEGNVVGHTLAVSGGIHWEYPQLIMELWNYEKRLKASKKMGNIESCFFEAKMNQLNNDMEDLYGDENFDFI